MKEEDWTQLTLNDSILTQSSSHNISHRKTIGAFYTPLNVSAALSEWGIQSSDDRILEPCFGGCTFLDAATTQLRKLGSLHPGSNLFGCDIDPLAFRYLESRTDCNFSKDNFYKQDFIELDPASLAKKMNLVIGNPPYIRHSNFSSIQRETIGKWNKQYGALVDKRASLWVYFVLHAMKFLTEGGRMAWVLPGSFLHAAYSQEIRRKIARHFRKTVAISIAERLFISEGTEETTVVLLAEGYSSEPVSTEHMQTACVDRVVDLKEFLNGKWSSQRDAVQPYPELGLVSKEAGRLHFEVSQMINMHTLGELAEVQIGLVTGDKKFFIKSLNEWRKLNITKHNLKYILPRSQWVHGIELRDDDIAQHINENIQCLSFICSSVSRSERALSYLSDYPTEAREKNATFRKREIWHQYFDNRIPDAFFVFMTSYGPRLVLNSGLANATNSFYRVYFKEKLSNLSKKIIAISFHSTFTQLGAEIIGHAKGSGALKLEPSQALKLKLYLPDNASEKDIDLTFAKIDRCLRGKDLEKARLIADDFLFRDHISGEKIEKLHDGLLLARKRRMRKMDAQP